jgi:hypothetical protein
MGAAIDANTGAVTWFPGTICCWAETDDKFEPVLYKLTSRLILFSGARNEKDGDDARHYYELKDGKFVHIRSVPKSAK